METLQVDVLIVGGGIMGLALAEAYSRKFKVLCVRLSDEGVPRAETLRNQGWLQSGTRYYWAAVAAGDEDHCGAALEMVYAARDIRQSFPMFVSDSAGIQFRRGVPDDRERSGTLLDGQVVPELALEPITDQATIEHLAGDLAHPQTVAVRTAERAFEEARLLEALREHAVRRDARLQTIEAPAELRWAADDRVYAVVDGILVHSQRIVVAAGVGAVGLAKQLGLTLPMKIRRTPLLLTRDPPGGSASVINDSVRQFSVCWHQVHNERIGVVGCAVPDASPHVIAFDDFDSTDHSEANRRRISSPEILAIQAHLPPAFQAHKCLVRGGFEPTHLKHRDWRYWFAEVTRTLDTGASAACRNLLFVFPGRATFALKVAQIVQDRDSSGDWEYLASISPQASFFEKRFPGREWTSPIRMHYEPMYSHLHEVEP